ncbi:hypothetical protein P3521_20360 [Vibrio parahaemolyticus]|uniref:hypothetical protein n=1 Tax=Vibrio parahaemolyticus TaxID=670 RepID=UPI00186A88A9|nr:hypothetical protein [Vibrio parahaemolyticus]MBE3793483.1 hypothetical protein [Vibrio parahaemolyticus]MBE3866475.1 hypothetical protein [Vibrio parahaemolyticus]MCC3796857.1 hypothetical protein [Vibrio parahaemolyticus]MCC3811665.1 hypothetical protein [Vibrio parahaemolyticus]MCR9727940.1 hypothetical protein [Vibrio parahaemolyticus]
MPIVKSDRLIILAILGIGGIMLTQYPFAKNDGIWGNDPDEHYITVKGKKPADARVSAWVTMTAGGDECESYSYDMFGRKAFRGGTMDRKITYDFSDDPNYYELRFPYRTYKDSNNCTVTLRDFSLFFINAFSGFGNLEIFEPFSYEHALPIDSIFEAKECDADIFENNLGEWLGQNRCTYYINGERHWGDHPDHINLDFSKFNDDTVIHYDVYAGEKYRSEPLDRVLGP